MYAPKANTSPRPPSTSVFHILSLLLIGIIPLLATLILIAVSPQFSQSANTVFVALVCAGFVVMAVLMEGRIEDGVWAGPIYIGVMIAWFSLGLVPALLIIVGSLAAVVLLQVYGASTLRLKPVTWRGALMQAGGRFVLMSVPLTLAAFIYLVLGYAVPLREIDGQRMLPLALALLGGFCSVYLMGMLLVDASVLPNLADPEQRGRMMSELTLLPLPIVLPLVLNQVGVGVFAVMMFTIAVQGMRYRQVGQTARVTDEQYQQSRELVRRLSLINNTVQDVMFNFNQAEVLTIACKTALDVTMADRAAILLMNRERETLNLEVQIGLTAAHQELLKNIPFHAPRYTSDLNLVSDAQQIPEMAEAAQKGGYRAFAEMPLRSGHLLMGYLVVYHNQPHIYTESDQDILEILSNQIAAAIDNAQLVRVLETYTFETTHLVYLSNISNSSMELDKVAPDIASVLREMMGVDWCVITLLESGTTHLRLLASNSDGNEPPTLPQNTDMLYFAEAREMRYKPLLLWRDQDSRSPGASAFMEQNDLSVLAIAPMIAHQTQLGVIFLGKHGPYTATDREEQLLQTAANQVATQLYNTLLYNKTYAELNQQLQQLSLIEGVVQHMSGTHDFTEIIQDVFDAAVKSTGADLVALALLTEADDFWVIIQQEVDGETRKYYTTQDKSEGVIGEAVRTGEPVLIRNNDEVPFYVASPPGQYLSSLAVPLRKEGRVAGVLNVESRHPNFFNPDQATFMKNLGDHAMISIDNARLLEELQYQIDALTLLRGLSLSLSSAVETDSVATAVLEAATRILPSQHVALFRYDESTLRLTLMSSIESGNVSDKPLETDVLRQVARRAALMGETQAIEDIHHTRGYQLPQVVHYPAMICIPIKQNNRVQQVLCVVFDEPRKFESRDLNTLSLLASQAAGHLENASLHKQIGASNNRMRAILDSTRDGVILLDQDARIAEVNASAQRLLGINLGEHIGERFVDVLLYHTEFDGQRYAGYTRDELNDLAKSPWLYPEKYTRRQFEHRTAQGEIIHIEEIGSMVYDEQNHITGRLLVLRDITEQKLLDAYREEITKMMIHDLRAPLASIINSINVATQSVNPDDNSRLPRTLVMARDSADKMMDLVNSILDIARLENRQSAVQLVPTPVRQPIESAYRALSSSIQKAGLNIEFLIPENLPEVMIDQDKIRRVFINLLDNAVRYTPFGGSIQISVTSELDEGRLLVKVCDSGPGIPEKARERIFGKYEQVKENQPLRGSKGTGLGLAFCKLVIEAHGQRIWVESNGPLPGACFAFTLPVYNPDA